MTVLDGVEHDLQAMGDLAQSGTAELARAMATKIDSGKGSPSECGKVLIEALAKLREQQPPERKKDGLDKIAEQREKRLKRVATASH